MINLRKDIKDCYLNGMGGGNKVGSVNFNRQSSMHQSVCKLIKLNMRK